MSSIQRAIQRRGPKKLVDQSLSKIPDQRANLLQELERKGIPVSVQ